MLATLLTTYWLRRPSDCMSTICRPLHAFASPTPCAGHLWRGRYQQCKSFGYKFQKHIRVWHPFATAPEGRPHRGCQRVQQLGPLYLPGRASADCTVSLNLKSPKKHWMSMAIRACSGLGPPYALWSGKPQPQTLKIKDSFRSLAATFAAKPKTPKPYHRTL